LRIRSGSGLAVVIEGVDDGDDEWVYSQWFAELSHLITFYPQDGYSRVVDAVEKLQKGRQNGSVLGIIDRDFATELEIKAQFEPDYSGHVYRTNRYTLENYLLEPQGWLEIASLFWRSNLPKGYRDLEECTKTIDDIFRSFIPAAAYNWMVWDINQYYNPSFSLEYKNIPNLNPEKLYQNLLIYCQRQGLPNPDEYFLRVELLSTKKELWHQKISGKMIFYHLIKTFPVPRLRPDKHIFVNYYVSRTEAPKELSRLVHFLIEKYLGKESLAKTAV
jgi:hypothetical protein